MASRLDVQVRREALYRSLRESCRDGSLPPGVMLPTVRELGERHGVSANVVFGVVRVLTDEGLLYTVPRVGTFVGRPQREELELYLMIVPWHEYNAGDHWVRSKTGFEDRISQLGARSMVLTADEATSQYRKGNLPPLAGLFIRDARADILLELQTPRVAFGNPDAAGAALDLVSFDDTGGGAQATQHLWQAGHRVIAFLGLHGAGEAGDFAWSLRRENGWQSAVEQAGGSVAGLAYYPARTSARDHSAQVAAGREAAGALAQRLAAQGLPAPQDITAVVAANFAASKGMFEAFEAAGLQPEEWPAVVCFDGAPAGASGVISYLRLPWEDVGREAAQLLWERHNGKLTTPTATRSVPMRLIARLSCRPDWAVTTRGLSS